MKLPQIEISLKYKGTKKSELKQITSSQDTYNILKLLFDADTFDWKEEMILLCLNQANKLIGYYKVSSGGISGTICDPKVVFTIALNSGASSLILAHNHPSGNMTPSNADKEVTEKIKQGGKLLDIKLLDHIIVSDENYFSFADDNLI